MSDTYTAEHRSLQWELVLQYEDGSIPAAAWDVATLTKVADWYAANLTREQATTRYEEHYHRNHHRLLNRRDGATVKTEAIEAVDKVWQSLLSTALEKAGK